MALFGGFALIVAILVSVVREARTDELAWTSLEDAPPHVESEPLPAWQPRSLSPVMGTPGDAPAVPLRLRPHRVVSNSEATKLYVTTRGRESAPASEVLVISVEDRSVLERVRVGLAPQGLALHPGGRWLLVTNRFSNFVTVIDTLTDSVASQIAVPFYCEDVVVSADGRHAYVSNFWKGQVMVLDLETDNDRLDGTMRELGFDREAFVGTSKTTLVEERACEECGWRAIGDGDCPRCGSSSIQIQTTAVETRMDIGINGILRSRCGQAGCHLHANRTFVAGPHVDENFRRATILAFPESPENSPLLRMTRPVSSGGTANAVDGRHHAGGVVFEDERSDSDYARLRDWIANGREGPGIDVGQQPRDLLLSPDGRLLYVANTGSVDVSVIDLDTLSETRRIFVRSPVNDLAWIGEDLLFATLGVGSGHPGERNPERESVDPRGRGTEFTLWRDLDTGQPLPLEQQRPMGPYDDVDGTAQEKFRDITNDVVLLDPSVDDVAHYAAEEEFTRYTSDSFETLEGDVKGDVVKGLMRVAGAFPEQIAVAGDRAYITMSGTSQVQEWQHVPGASPVDRLQPKRTFETGFQPTGIVVLDDALAVVDQISDSLTFIELSTGEATTLALDPNGPRFPADDFERGELLVRTSLFSVDQDQSCVHCHYRDASDGKRWSVSQVMGQTRDGHERTGGSREVPDLRNLSAETPFFLEGTLSIDEPLTMMMEHNPLIDFSRPTPAGDFSGVFAGDDDDRVPGSADAIVVATGRPAEATGVRTVDLIERREQFFLEASRRHMRRAVGFREAQRLIGVFQASESRLLPNPEDPHDPMVRRGRAIFMSPETGCAGCHPPPNFKDSRHVDNGNGSFPPLVTAAPRDDVHTLISADRLDSIMGFVRPWDPDDPGRVEEREGFFVAPSLRGLWARPARFLHHGRALSLREVISAPGHPGLRPRALGRRDPERPAGVELGLNERDGMLDSHGATSHLGVWDLECLRRFLLSIE
jgi:YVTN family beta-propeller protein